MKMGDLRKADKLYIQPQGADDWLVIAPAEVRFLARSVGWQRLTMERHPAGRFVDGFITVATTAAAKVAA